MTIVTAVLDKNTRESLQNSLNLDETFTYYSNYDKSDSLILKMMIE